jgi:NAD(P)-dependent dehydrogenase (short-subunit alcohol dehydrogenase family)
MAAIMPLMPSFASSSVMWFVSSVATAPGSIMVMRMLSSWSSCLKASEMALTANLVPEYAPRSGPLLRPATLEMLTMCPDCCSFITAMAASVAYRSPRTLDNNAAVYHPPDILDLAEEDWDRVVDTNVKGIYLCCKAVIPRMMEGGGGSIINLGSIVSFIALDGPQGLAPAYVASKGAVLQLTRALAVRHGRDNIRVNCVCPGFIETEMVEKALAGMADSPQLREEIREGGAAAHLLGRFGKPEEVANAILFLASDESSFVTGSPLHVDGGYLAR